MGQKFTIAGAMLGLVAAIAVSTAAPRAQAQAFPAKPLRMIVPFPPGGSTDLSSRQLATEMSAILGQSVIVENKPGAAGGIGIAEVARAEPDGYTLGIAGVGPSILLNLSGQFTQYIATRDLAFVSHMNMVELLLVARKDLPANDIPQMIAYAKANPGKVNIGNSGQLGPVHLAAALLADQTGISVGHVAYRGDPPLLQDLMGGQIETGIVSVAVSGSQIRAGAVKALGMMGGKRSASFPDLPTIAEQGVSGYDSSVFQIVVAPAKTPAATVAKLNEAINRALATERIRTDYAKLGMVATGGSPADADAFIRRETEKLARGIDILKAAAK